MALLVKVFPIKFCKRIPQGNYLGTSLIEELKFYNDFKENMLKSLCSFADSLVYSRTTSFIFSQ